MKRILSVILVCLAFFQAHAILITFKSTSSVAITKIVKDDILKGSATETGIELTLAKDRTFSGHWQNGTYSATFTLSDATYVVDNAQAACANAQQAYAEYLALGVN